MKIRSTLAERLARKEQRQLKGETPPAVKVPRDRPASHPRVVLSPVPTLEWHGCYGESWRGQITSESFAHPAKAAQNLLTRIFQHLFDIGALVKNSTCVDPFAGIFTTGIRGTWMGVQVYGCELEEKFFTLAHANIALHRAKWEHQGLPIPVIVQGDSRQLRRHLGPVMDAIVSSPPYANPQTHERGGIFIEGTPGQRGCKDSHAPAGFIPSNTPGDIGNMKLGEGVDAVISSPPYAEIATGAGGLNTQPPQHKGQQGGRSAESASQDTDQRYGDAEGQLAKMPKDTVDAIVSSPPYADGALNDSQRTIHQDGLRAGDNEGDGTYGDAEGQLAKMAKGEVDVVISSPPYVDQPMNPGETSRPEVKIARLTAEGKHEAAEVIRQHGMGAASNFRQEDYGETDGQLGNMNVGAVDAMSSDTFWTAARDIVRESYAILKPGGHAAWIVKAFVRNKQIVDFPNDWRKLCEYVGFETLTEVHAMLVKEDHSEIWDTEGERQTMTKKTERKSFFRRLAESKGSPKIDHEVVYIMVKR